MDAACTHCIFQMPSPPVAGISVNEVLFGSNGLHQRPANPVVFQNYEMCMDMEGEKDYFVKVIANTDHVLRSLNPHHFEFQVS